MTQEAAIEGSGRGGARLGWICHGVAREQGRKIGTTIELDKL